MRSVFSSVWLEACSGKIFSFTTNKSIALRPCQQYLSHFVFTKIISFESELDTVIPVLMTLFQGHRGVGKLKQHVVFLSKFIAESYLIKLQL